MKKIWSLLILLCPLVIKAESIKDYYINATLNSNGNLLVEEYVLPQDDNNYWEKNIYYQDKENTENKLDYANLNNASGIELLTVGSVPKIKNNQEEIKGVKEFTKVNVASTGDSNVYLSRSDTGKEYLRIYKNSKEAYYLKYLIKDLAVKYNDIGEIYFNALKDNQDKITNLKITINLPDNNKAYSFNKGKDVKKIINKNYQIEYQYKDIKEKEDIKLRILFNKDIIRAVRIGEESFPSIVIRDIDTFEKTLEEYITAIKSGDSWYNIFVRDGFYQRGEDENIKMILEAALVNATNTDARDIEVFFKDYTSYVLNEDLAPLRNLQRVGNLFDDDLYVMLKRSELWYETPFYISLMLCNKHIELPNVRLGIDFEKKCANIIAVQSSQVQQNTSEFTSLQETIKRVLPKDSYYRFINPSHLISLVITMGYLKAIGIDEILLKDYMPFRYKKVVYDKHLDEDEAEKLQTRLTTKNIATFLRIASNIDGINVMSYPGNSSELKLHIANDIHGKNQFIEDLFKLGYDLGQKNKCEKTRKLELN